MNEMENYLYNHAYVSNIKICNRQFELSKERAECIANKYNSLVEEKDKEIERLNNKIKQLNEDYKAVLHQRDDIAQNGTEMIENLLEKNKRLNNIIDKLEELLKQPWNIDCINQNNYFLDKLKELKEGK